MIAAVQSAVKERPILFSAPMVRAILDGRKKQTRRVLKPQPNIVDREPKFQKDTWGFWHDEHYPNGRIVHCPYGKPGERLWVREAWRKWENGGRQVAYAADHKCYEVWFRNGDPVSVWDDGFTIPADIKGYKPSIHMPRWASRLTLEIVSVRVERIQDISFEDCLAEGIITTDHWNNVKGEDIGRLSAEHPKEWDVDDSINQSWIDYTKLAYQSLWDSINGKRGFGWDVNPWVWAIGFRSAA